MSKEVEELLTEKGKFYYVTIYSFAAEKPVAGPFLSEIDAWNAMKSVAEEEYRIDTEENGYEDRYTEDRDSGEITLTTIFPTHTDVTHFFIICIADNT